MVSTLTLAATGGIIARDWVPTWRTTAAFALLILAAAAGLIWWWRRAAVPPAHRPQLRLGVFALLSGLLGIYGGYYDAAWHAQLGRDTFWSPLHVLIYGGVALVLVVAVLALLALRPYGRTWAERMRRAPPWAGWPPSPSPSSVSPPSTRPGTPGVPGRPARPDGGQPRLCANDGHRARTAGLQPQPPPTAALGLLLPPAHHPGRRRLSHPGRAAGAAALGGHPHRRPLHAAAPAAMGILAATGFRTIPVLAPPLILSGLAGDLWWRQSRGRETWSAAGAGAAGALAWRLGGWLAAGGSAGAGRESLSEEALP